MTDSNKPTPQNWGYIKTWPERLKQEGITAAGWTSDRNLWAFLREEVGPDLELAKASDCGLW